MNVMYWLNASSDTTLIVTTLEAAGVADKVKPITPFVAVTDVGVSGTPFTNTSTSKSAAAISVANEPLQLSNALTVQTPAAAVVKSRKTTSYFDTIKS